MTGQLIISVVVFFRWKESYFCKHITLTKLTKLRALTKEEDIRFCRSLIFRSNRPEVLCKKSVLRNLAKLTGKRLCQSLFFNKVADLRHRCFPVNFAKFLRTHFLQDTSGRLLLDIQLPLFNIGCFLGKLEI